MQQPLRHVPKHSSRLSRVGLSPALPIIVRPVVAEELLGHGDVEQDPLHLLLGEAEVVLQFLQLADVRLERQDLALLDLGLVALAVAHELRLRDPLVKHLPELVVGALVALPPICVARHGPFES